MFIPLLLTVALVLASCNRNTIYSSYQSTSLEGWEWSDTLFFEVAPIAKSGLYEEQVGIRINSSFPFTSLSLVVMQQNQHTPYVRIDTLHAQLFDHEGNVEGHGVNYYQYTFSLTTLRLEAGDTLRVAVKHDMRREIVPGVSDVGIKIIETDDV